MGMKTGRTGGWVRGPMPSNRRILVAEDDAEVAGVVVEILKREGYVCQHVRDGRSALEEAASSPPDLIILDRGLPGCSGDDVLRELKQVGILAGIVVVLLIILFFTLS